MFFPQKELSLPQFLRRITEKILKIANQNKSVIMLTMEDVFGYLLEVCRKKKKEVGDDENGELPARTLWWFTRILSSTKLTSEILRRAKIENYLATSLRTSSTFLERSTSIGSAGINCCVLWPCNVVAPDLHAGSRSTTLTRLDWAEKSQFKRLSLSCSLAHPLGNIDTLYDGLTYIRLWSIKHFCSRAIGLNASHDRVFLS